MPGQETRLRRQGVEKAELAKKLAILFVVSLVATVLFFPHLTFRGYHYASGEVAPVDVKSPVTAEAPGVSVKKGEVIVRQGQVIDERDLERFRLVEGAVEKARASVPAAGFFALVAALIFSTVYFASRNIRKFASKPRDLVLLASVFTGVLLLLKLSDTAALLVGELVPGPAAAYRYIVPVAVGPMLVRLLLNSETAIVFAAVVAVVAGYFTGGVELSAFALAGGAAAAAGVRHCTHRSIVIRAGVLVGAVNAVVLLAIAALRDGLSDPVAYAAAGMANGLITAVIAIGVAPALEALFQYTTDIRLLELSRMEHPLLKELALKAPGTYHHSIVIGTLAEAAAESINANPLLARVAAYYHDIGKTRMPQYFVENASGENRHSKLTPSMSSLILSNHVKEGVELARRYRLGAEITDIISQHHGTALITFFYQKARSQAPDEVQESDYRYPGPKPQTKEAGIVMLADAIEAASKTLPEPSPDRVQWLSQKIVNKIFSDGQLDECELTLKDLHAITRSFNRVFAGMYHQRVEYPEPVDVLKEKSIEGAGPGKRADEGKEDGRDRLKRLGV